MAKLKPLAKEHRHPADYRDEIEHEDVVEILSDLPDDHVAIYAYYTGAKLASSTAGLALLLPDRMDLVARLTKAVWQGVERTPNAVASDRRNHGPQDVSLGEEGKPWNT